MTARHSRSLVVAGGLVLAAATVGLFALGGGVVGCGDGGGGGVRDQGPPPDRGDGGAMPDRPVDMSADMPAAEQSIRAVQNRMDLAHPMPGSTVVLKQKVALAPKVLLSDRPDAKVCEYGVFIAEPSGGGYAGILVITRDPERSTTGAPCPGPAEGGMALPADTRAGDLFDVTGQYEEFQVPAAETGCTQMGGAPCDATYAQVVVGGGKGMATRTGSGAKLPDPLIITGMDQGGDELNELRTYGTLTDITERVRGMLISIPNTRVTCAGFRPGIDAVAGTAMGCVKGGMADGGAGAMGTSDGVWIKKQPGFAFTTTLAEGDTFTSVQGVVYYDSWSGRWLVLPRTNDDLVR